MKGLLVGSIVTGFIAVALLVGLIWGNVLRPTPKAINVVEGPIAGDPLDLVLAPTMSAETLAVELDPLRTYLERVLRRPVRMPVGQTYGEAAAQLTSGKVPFASLPPNLYIQTRETHPDVRIVAVKIHGESWGSDAVILASDRSGLEKISEVRGKWICYTDPQSTTSYILPRAKLRSLGIDPDRHLAGARVSGNHLQLLRDLIDGKCDFGGTFMDNFLNARTQGVNPSQLKLLGKTGRTPHDAICAGPSATSEMEADMRAALLGFDPQRDAGVPELGAMERITGFGQIDDAAYDKLRIALRAERAATAR